MMGWYKNMSDIKSNSKVSRNYNILLPFGIGLGIITSIILYPLGEWIITASYTQDKVFFILNVILFLLSAIIFYKRYHDFWVPHIIIPFFYTILLVPSIILLSLSFATDTVHKMYQVALLGHFSFILGGLTTLLFSPKVDHTDLPMVVNIRLPQFKIASLGVWLVGMSALLLTFIVAGIPLLSQDPQLARFEILHRMGGYINNLYILLIPASILIIVNYYLKNISLRWIVILISISALFYFLLAFRSRVIYTLVASAITMIYSTRFINRKVISYWQYAKYFVIFIPLMIFIFVWVGYYRLEKTGEANQFASLLGENIFILAIAVIALYLRSFTFVFGKVIELAQTNGFLFGQSYLNAIFAPLPGFSPQLLDSYLKDQIFAAGFSGGGSPPTILGESYLNFGIPGVIIVLFLIGFLLSFLYQRLLRDRKISTLVLFCFFYQFFLISGMYAGMLLYFDYVLAWLAIMTVIYVSKRSS